MNTTPASSSIRALTSATKQVAPLVVAACLALAAGVPASGATYYWDVDGNVPGLGGTGTWNTTNPYFSLSQDGDEDGVAWSNAEHTVIFDGTGGLVDLASSFDLNQLTINAKGYVLTGGALNFVNSGTTLPTLRIRSGVVAMFDTTISAAAMDLKGGGIFSFGRNDLFADSTAINLAGGTTMNLAGHSDTVGSLTLTSGAISGGGSLGASSYLLKSGTVDVNLTGDGSLTKDTLGALTLGGSNTYTGATTVAAGTLVLTGTNTGTSGTTVNSGGTLWLAGGRIETGNVVVASGGLLAGNGRIATNSLVTVNGGISPGKPDNSDVDVLYSGSQIWGSTGVFNLNINALPQNGTAGKEWDLIDLGGGTLSIGNNFTLKVIGLTSVPGFDPSGSYSWLIASNISAITVGTNIRILLGDVVTPGFGLKSAGGGLYLDYAAVPEPKDYAMILGAITLGLVGYRRWRRTAQFA